MNYRFTYFQKITGSCFKYLFSLFLLVLFHAVAYSQNQYLVSLDNGTLENDNTFEFDVFIKSTGTDFTLTSYQCAFSFNVQNNGGSFTFSFLSGSSQLSNEPTRGIGIKNTDGIPELTFGSMAGSDIITNTSKKIGRFRLQSSAVYSGSQFGLTWNFDGFINTILTGPEFINITNPAYHSNLNVTIDNTSPSLINASAEDAESVVLNFSEQIKAVSANNIANYSINNNITVTSAVLSPGGTSVTLTTLPHTSGIAYTVTANNIEDPAGNLISPSANSAQYLYDEAADLRVNAKVFLEGPFTNGSMYKLLNDFGYIPLNQPFNTSPWNYNGEETVNSIPEDAVDWVLLELRSGTSSSTTKAKRAAFIKTDGSIVDLNGVSKVRIKGVEAGDYYLVIRHRNHLAIMSASKITLSSNPSLYDFTTASNKAYGNGGQTSLGNGKYGMYAGDGNGNGTVNSADANNTWKQQNGNIGYHAGDYDVNGGVNIVDKNDKWKINQGKSSKVPN